MALSSLGVLSRTTSKPLRKFLKLTNHDSLRFFSAICCGRQKRKFNLFKKCYSNIHPDIITPDYPELKLPDMPVHEFIAENVGQWEDKIAVECGASGKKWTYKDLIKYSRGLAASLQKKFKVKKGDVIAAILPNCPEYPAVYLAGSMTGSVTTTINTSYTATEISLQLQSTKPKIIFTIPDAYKKCVEAVNLSKMKIPIAVVQNYPDAEIPQGAISFSELIDTPGDFTPVSFNFEDDIVLPFSSGTSGLPKGVQLSHKNIIANLIQYAMGNELKINPTRESDQCAILAILPMFHIYGMVIMTLDGLREGAKLVSLPKFEPKLFIETIYTKKTELLYLVPPLVFFLGNQPMAEPKHLKSVRHVVTGAAPCGEADLVKLIKKGENLSVSQGYGMTETSPVITMTYKGRFHKVSSAGHPVASTLIKVADIRNGRPLPVGNRGEICVKGPQVMKGYFNQPEETKKIFDEDGWLKTGDVGYYDEEKDFFIVDRMKELIKVKGFQVAPAELEEFLRSHPKISDAGVIGIDHPEYGQAPKAYVVRKEGVSLTEDEVKDYIRDRLSNYKRLTGGVEFINEIPKSVAGKILRKELKKLNSQ